MRIPLINDVAPISFVWPILAIVGLVLLAALCVVAALLIIRHRKKKSGQSPAEAKQDDSTHH